MQERFEIVGWVRNDPVVVTTRGGYKSVYLAVPVTRSAVDGLGRFKLVTVWHHLKGWNRLAERAVEILRNGSLAVFSVRIDYRSIDMVKEDGGSKRITVPTLTLMHFQPLHHFEAVQSGRQGEGGGP